MAWKKEGRIFVPGNHYAWMVSHAQVPTVLVREDKLTVFFATRNDSGQSQIAKIDMDKRDPKQVMAVHAQPVLSPGKAGTFDEDGVMPGSVLQVKDEIWLYYTGWNKKVSTPYHNAIGLAVSKDQGETFTRLYHGPLLDRTKEEPYIAITPCVIKDQSLFKMWYASGTDWLVREGKHEPVYVIKYATSVDGLTWQRYSDVCIPPHHAQEALCAPTVLIDNKGYHMWFSYRDSCDYRDSKGSYRIGYAVSRDGINWQRMDEKAGIDVSVSDWDSTMLCYPCVFKQNEQRYMMYNGNGFGQSGFGYATQSVDKE